MQKKYLVHQQMQKKYQVHQLMGDGKLTSPHMSESVALYLQLQPSAESNKIMKNNFKIA